MKRPGSGPGRGTAGRAPAAAYPDADDYGDDAYDGPRGQRLDYDDRDYRDYDRRGYANRDYTNREGRRR